ncbi:probable NOT transcription complex subunit VIP2 isoform X1 [Olea europaea subsp. europaea]|uniref:Probable NOT transcription complex subunit VIP2 isoform X1 n=2 Tax=Olea europaea subsp. europaea TaxID=158383 RepID=A0A8S0QH89_OLEEU|nr:probable NOT transcription complex subunit VIP2 isoform X1 [Olea europaea subsp. europaea]
MSGVLGSALNGSNSNLSDTMGRPFATSFSAQTASSGAVLNQSGGTIQGPHYIHGNFNISNMSGSFASRNSTNIGGLPNSIQQAAGNVSNGRYAMNSIPTALSQLSLGSSNGHGGVNNIGGPGVLQNMGNNGRITNSVGSLNGGGNTTRGLSSAGLANIPGLASRLNLSAPQMVSMLGNSYSAAGVPLSQNQYQAGNNHFSFMQLLNDSSAHENATFDVNDFPQLSGRPPAAGGSQGQLGLMKHNIGFTQHNQEFSIQNEDFPALTGYRGNAEFPVNARQKEQLHASTEFPVNARQKEQLHDSMASLMQPQQLTMGRSSGFNFSGTYSSHHPQQQHHASSINGSGASLLTAGNQDFHFHGPEYQQFQQSQSRFISPFRDKDLKSMQALQSVPDRFGMLGLLSVIKMTNPGLSSLALGIDLTSLGLNLNSSETIHKKFASPWSDEPARGEPEYSVPECYYAKPPPPVNQSYFARFSQETLFYIFYSMPKDRAQLFAANELYTRGWFYHKDLRLWFTRVKDMEPLVETNTYERGSYYFFDPNTWQMTRKDNFVLIYEMVEKRPTLPQ